MKQNYVTDKMVDDITEKIMKECNEALSVQLKYVDRIKENDHKVLEGFFYTMSLIYRLRNNAMNNKYFLRDTDRFGNYMLRYNIARILLRKDYNIVNNMIATEQVLTNRSNDQYDRCIYHIGCLDYITTVEFFNNELIPIIEELIYEKKFSEEEKENGQED